MTFQCCFEGEWGGWVGWAGRAQSDGGGLQGSSRSSSFSLLLSRMCVCVRECFFATKSFQFARVDMNEKVGQGFTTER